MARTFIQPGDQLRKHGLRMKFNPLREVVEGKRLVVVDDSIVRGNTTRQIVSMLRDAGALEVHMRISAPPIRYPCHYGVDMSTKQEMVAHGRTVDEIAEELECDSIAYLSLEGVYEAIRGEAGDPLRRLLLGQLPAGAQRHRERQVRARRARRPTHVTTPARCAKRAATAGPDRPGPALLWPFPWTSTQRCSSNFGFSGFRAGQREACEAALADRDVLVVMPTGSGKSLCYQLPGLMRADLTVVVSPLVALMQDQVEALHARGVGDQVALVNAQQDQATNAGVMQRAADGSLRLLYVSPERFASPGFLDRMRSVDIGLFVVDEAHCVSQWGHDFRPDYFRLADAARHLEAKAIVASTATATPQVAVDIVRRLGLREPLKVATGFDRPNLSFAVARPAPHEKRPLIAEALGAEDALPAIVYAGTRAGPRRSPTSSPSSWASRPRPTTPAWPASSAPRCSAASSPTRCA